MADYSPQIATAKRLIAKAGALWTFRTTPAVTVGPEEYGDVTDGVPVDLTANAVKFHEGSDINIYIEADSLADVLTDGMEVIDPQAISWGFVQGSIKPLDPAGDGQIILYEAKLTTWPNGGIATNA